MKIKRKYKIWGATLLIHLTLIFLFSNFGLKYKNPPDPQQSIEIEFDTETQGDEEKEAPIPSSEDTEEIDEEIDKEVNEEVNEEINEEVETSKETSLESQKTDDTQLEEDFKNKQDIINQRLQQEENKEEEDINNLVKITTKTLGETGAMISIDGGDGIEINLQDGSGRDVTPAYPKTITYSEDNEGYNDLSRVEVHVLITVNPDGSVRTAKIDANSSSLNRSRHGEDNHESRSKKAAKKFKFGTINEAEGIKEGVIIFIYKF